MQYSFIVEGNVVPQERPRFTTFNGYGRGYEREPIRDYKKLIYDEAYLCFIKGGKKLLQGPLQAEITVYKEVPKSFSKKKREMAYNDELLPAQRPDLDNYIKMALDGIGMQTYKGNLLEKVIFNDDSQIVLIVARKKYSPIPRLEVTLSEII